MMMYYDFGRFTGFNSIVSPDFEPLADFFPFVMFGRLYGLGTEVDSGEYDIESPVAVCAAKGKGKGAVMIANMNPLPEEMELRFELKGWEQFTNVKAYVLSRRFSPVLPLPFLDQPVSGQFSLKLEGFQSLVYLTFE